MAGTIFLNLTVRWGSIHNSLVSNNKTHIIQYGSALGAEL